MKEETKFRELAREFGKERPSKEEFSFWEKEIVAKGELFKALECGLLFMRSLLWALAALGTPISKKEEKHGCP